MAAVEPGGGMRTGTHAEDADDLVRRLEELNQIGVALSREADLARLLESILVAAKQITNADGGTLYRRHDPDDDLVHFEILRTDSLGIALGGTTGVPVPFEAIRLHDDRGAPNTAMVVAYQAVEFFVIAATEGPGHERPE
jgi:hypothetical protein